MIYGKGIKYIEMDYALDAIYSTTSGPSRLAFQIISPKLDNYAYSQLEVCLVVDYFTEGSVTGQVDLFDYTTFEAITGTQYALPNVTVWTTEQSPFYDITDRQGKSLSMRFERLTGQGNNKVSVEGAKLIFKLS